MSNLDDGDKNMSDHETTVRELALHQPGAARVFEELHIDYCCGGARSLREACERAGVSLDAALARLDRAPPDATSDVWESRPMGELIDHILVVHHEHDRREIERLRALSTKVASVHGGGHPEVVSARVLFDKLASELEPHMMKEEQVLFPYVRKLEAAERAGAPVATPFFGTVANPVRMMMAEHDVVGSILRDLRTTTREYVIPEGACASYATLYHALEEFERELHLHIHLENELLFPRAFRTERALPRGK